jgi:RHS repeat-associated protein
MTVTGSSSAGTPFSFVYSGVYDEYGRLTSQSGPNGVTQTNVFNDAGQLSSMSYGSAASTVLSWSREYDGYGRVIRELAPDSSSSASPKATVYGYDSSSRLATVSSNGASCFSESYSYNARGDRTSSSVGVCGATTTKTNTFNSESQLTTSGYVYDSLGRNTFIPAFDAPANNAGINLAYNLVDQVTGITQNGSTTSFTYDALGRRVNETVGNLTTVRHYSDSSDNPEWTTQQSGANLTTEIYTGSLGAGLAVTTTFKGTARTSSMQLTDIRGHTVTTLDLDTNSVGAWSVYDSFGNPQTSQTNTNLINYSSYGQQERATNTTGLILMGARVYNPETNQFTSKDPIKGGNENSYTYPNDPINGSDFTGLWDGWDTLDVALTLASFIPIPGLQQVAWIAKGAYLAYRMVSIEIRAINLIKKLRKSEKLGENLNDLQATNAVSARAGVRWTGSTKKYEGKGGKIYHLKSPKAQYRSPDLKTNSGMVQSNFESRAVPIKKNKWVFDHHVTIKAGTTWRP